MAEQDSKRGAAQNKTVRSLSRLRGILERLGQHVEPKQWIIDDVQFAIKELEGVVEVLEQPETVEFQVAAINIHAVSPQDFVSPQNQRAIRDAIAQTLRRACRAEPIEPVAGEPQAVLPKSFYQVLDEIGLLGPMYGNSSDTSDRWRNRPHITPLIEPED